MKHHTEIIELTIPELKIYNKVLQWQTRSSGRKDH